MAALESGHCLGMYTGVAARKQRRGAPPGGSPDSGGERRPSRRPAPRRA